MNYDIKIIGEDSDNGTIEFDRLNNLIKSTKNIATKSLMLRLRGFSDIKPDKNLQKALSLFLENVSGNSQDGTSLTIGATHFYETIKGVQYDLFKPNEEILKLTPMALVIDTFNIALSDIKDNVDIDKPLLKTLLTFKNNFISDNEIFYLSNRGSIPEVKLTRDDFQKISVLEDSIPAPKKIIINGQLDEMKFSKGKLGLQTNQGLVNVFATDNKYIETIIEFMGRDITISGIAHYKPNGQLSFIEIQDFGIPTANDEFFSKKPTAMTANQQILFQTKQVKKRETFDALKEMSGLLKDEISDDEFEEMIKDIHR